MANAVTKTQAAVAVAVLALAPWAARLQIESLYTVIETILFIVEHRDCSRYIEIGCVR